MHKTFLLVGYKVWFILVRSLTNTCVNDVLMNCLLVIEQSTVLAEDLMAVRAWVSLLAWTWLEYFTCSTVNYKLQ